MLLDMQVRGLSAESLMSAAADFCESASWALARGDAPRSQLFLETAVSLMLRRQRERARSDTRPRPIIVIEDDADIRDAVCDLLLEAGYDVLCFSNGAEALDHLRVRPSAALVLLDLSMPVMDGWTFHRRCREDGRLARIPVIAISASSAAGPPAVRVLRKPVCIDDLLSAVFEAIDGPAGRVISAGH
jgi:CheY-like chemotaxis protein